MKKIIIGFCFFIILIFFLKEIKDSNNLNTKEFTYKEYLFNDSDFCKLTNSNLEKIIGISSVSSHDEQSIDLFEDLDVKWVRSDFHWNLIEKENNVYNWEHYDNFVYQMYKRNIQISAIISHIPERYQYDENLSYKYSVFLDELINRYGKNGIFYKKEKIIDYYISVWEIFNEPNLPGYGWFEKKDTPESKIQLYSDILKISNIIIFKNNIDSVVVIGGFSPDGMNAIDFLKKLYGYGVGNCYDVFAFHPYGYHDSFKELYLYIKEELEKLGGTKKIWFNEYGTTDNDVRQEYMTKAFESLEYVDGLFWFSLKDLSIAGNHFGVVKYNYTKKEADYSLLKDLLKKD